MSLLASLAPRKTSSGRGLNRNPAHSSFKESRMNRAIVHIVSCNRPGVAEGYDSCCSFWFLMSLHGKRRQVNSALTGLERAATTRPSVCDAAEGRKSIQDIKEMDVEKDMCFLLIFPLCCGAKMCVHVL